MDFPLSKSPKPPTSRPPSARPPPRFVPTPAPALASAPPMPTNKTRLEAMLESYVSPLTQMRPENIAQYIAKTFGPPPPPGTPAFQQFVLHKRRSWQPFLRFLAARQMEHVTEVPKLLHVVDMLASRGLLDVAFVTDSIMDAYNAYVNRHIIYANRLYGFGLQLQARGFMMQVPFPSPPGEATDAMQRFLVPPAARGSTLDMIRSGNG